MDRLLVMTPTISPDTGWGRYSKAVVAGLRDHYEVDVRTDLPDPLPLRSSPVSVLRAARRIRRAIDDVDAVFSLVAYPYSLIAYLATRCSDVPYFVSCHGTYAVEPLHSKHRLPARLALSQAAAAFCVSTFTADCIRSATALQNLVTVPNGVTPVDDPPTPFSIDHRVLLTVGAFKPRKGQHLSAEAFVRIADEEPDVDYHLVGSGSDTEYADGVRNIVRENGLSDRVHFEGKVSDDVLERWYATAEAFVLTPQYINHHFEGFGLVYLEANRHGVPVVGTFGTGAEDAIADGVSGKCTRPNPDAVASGLREVLQSSQQFSEEAQRWAGSHTWTRTVETMVSVIDRHLADGFTQ
ncbi:glycosyltransferase family 4 protein [Haloarcula argentinensis]|uniref:glycosyltransferase family 4 protein n=1 Tax=Haloarcula argentinensis TaxID=43776 RepID=UPI00166712D7|nr:glycosyltransferase family 4 protein [Haloarcula argentinensis]